MNVNISRCSDTSILDVKEAFRPEDYSFTVDWLNVRLDCDNLGLVISTICSTFPEIDISDFVERESGGVCFYKYGVYLSTLGYSSFVISFNKDENGNIINHGEKRGDLYGIFLSITGDGCRFINSLHENGFARLLNALKPFNPSCSRIDIACDIFDKDNMIVPMIQTFADYAYDRENAPIDFNCGLIRGFYDDDGNFKYRQWVTQHLVFDNKIGEMTRNITIGGRDCKKGTLQLYNKRVEIEKGRLSDVSEAILNAVGNPDYWWRLEYRCKRFAQNVYDNLLNSGSIYSAFLQAANDMGTFVVPKYSYDLTRADDCAQWVCFLAFVEKLMNGKVFISYNSQDMVNLPYVDSILPKVQKFHEEQIPSSDAINLLLVMLDSDYRQRTFNSMFHQIFYNKKLKPALKEISIKYGLKLQDIYDLAYEQSSIFEEAI